MNILYITPYVPSLIRTRPYNLIRALVRLGHRVTLLTAAGNSTEEHAQVEEMRRYGVRAEVFPISLTGSLVNCLRALPTHEPLQAVYAYHPGMEKRLSGLLQQETFDVVHIEHLRASRLVRAVLASSSNGERMPAVYDSVDCISLLFEQAAQTGAQWRSRMMTAIDLERTRRYEAHLLARYDQIVITSRRDKEALEQLAHQYLSQDTRPAPVTVVTNGVDLEYFRTRGNIGQRDGRTVIFTGKMSYHANVTAVLYFAQQVLPRIWEKDPEVRFQVVGKDPPEAVRRLTGDERIQVTGTVNDLRPYLAQAAVAVCPVHYAVGVQNKVLEAMAMGKPVICTSATFAGLDAREGEEVLVADDAEAFAAQTLRLCADPALVQRLAVAGRRYVETHHSWETNAKRLVEVYEQARSRQVSEAGTNRPDRTVCRDDEAK
jgi:sugar transferase (PEP-CTERM/EpsH1 system associated)